MKHLLLRSGFLLGNSAILATFVLLPLTLRAQESVSADLAKTRAGANVVYVSSGPKHIAFQAIDDDRRTTFQFSNSDLRPTIAVELSSSEPIHRVSLVPGSQGGTVDVYLLNKLPRDFKDLGNAQPVGSIVDLAVGREAALEFEPRAVRFVVFRWTSLARPDALMVAEISAFGTTDLAAYPPPFVVAANPPPADSVLGPPEIANVSP